jgi:hypothetical protein
MLSELSSLQLAIKLLYTESNMTHTENEVRSHSVVTHNETSLSPTWCNTKSKLIKMDNQAGRPEILLSAEPVTTVNRLHQYQIFGLHTKK